MRIRRLTAAVALAVLSGCGSMPEERALTGAGLGAGAGAALGAATGGLSIATGAAIGAAAGAVTGAVTNDRQIDLGEPVWKRGSSNTAAAPVAAGFEATVASIQGGLRRLGYDPGAVDGRIGPRTEAAIRAYQRDEGLLVDGRVTPELMDHIQQSSS